MNLINRRQFLKLTALSAIGFILPESSFAAPIINNSAMNDFWTRNRYLDVRRTDNGEGGIYCFFRNGQFDLNAYDALCWLFRDAKDGNKAIKMDIGLFNLLWGIQEWERELGYTNVTYMLNSGYRTASRNERVNGAAKDSFHMYGKGSDGFYRNRPLSQSIAKAKYFNAGGVGTYGSFMHVDTGGKNRRW